MTWAPPDPQNDVPCPFFRCWIGPCGEKDRTKCRHTRSWTWAKDGDQQGPYGPQRDERCSCGLPAMSECEATSSLVCGMPICIPAGLCSHHGGHHQHVGGRH